MQEEYREPRASNKDAGKLVVSILLIGLGIALIAIALISDLFLFFFDDFILIPAGIGLIIAGAKGFGVGDGESSTIG